MWKKCKIIFKKTKTHKYLKTGYSVFDRDQTEYPDIRYPISESDFHYPENRVSGSGSIRYPVSNTPSLFNQLKVLIFLMVF